jgi:hypothetical protein
MMNPFHVGDLAYCCRQDGTLGNGKGVCRDRTVLEHHLEQLGAVRAEYRAIAPTCGKSKRKRFEKAIADKDRQISWCKGQLDSLEISPRKSPSGSLYKFLQNKRNKAGKVLTYPKVEGERDPDNPHHWFWAYCWDEKDAWGEWKTHKRSVRRDRLALVRNAIREGEAIAEILKLL